jgi:hypothetical protein
MGTGALREDTGPGELSSLVPDPRAAAMPKTPVTITTVDHEARTAGITRVHLLKIDCEGYDLQVLRGAAGLLGAQRVDVVQFEYNSQWAYGCSTLGAALQMLSEYGYAVYLLKHDGLWRFPYQRYGEFFTYANFVALARTANERLQPLVRGAV